MKRQFGCLRIAKNKKGVREVRGKESRNRCLKKASKKDKTREFTLCLSFISGEIAGDWRKVKRRVVELEYKCTIRNARIDKCAVFIEVDGETLLISMQERSIAVFVPLFSPALELVSTISIRTTLCRIWHCMQQLTKKENALWKFRLEHEEVESSMNMMFRER